MDKEKPEAHSPKNHKFLNSGFSIIYFLRYATPVVLAFAIPLIMLTALRHSAFEGENSVDSYYHIAMADMGSSVYLSKTFPWTTLSIWTDHFSDKELLYHISLSFVRSYQKLLNIPLSPPFNFPAIFFIGMLLAAFVYTAYYFKVRNIIYYSLLLIFISPFFTDRILMLRPHIISIALMLLACPLTHSIKRHNDLGKLFIFVFLTAWSYSNPHFILLPITAFAIIKYKRSPYLTLGIVLTSIIGLLTGLTLHPQFPNTFLIWKIQCIDVLLQTFKNSPAIHSAKELSSPTILWLISNAGAFIFTIYAFVILKKSHRHTPLSFSSPYIAFGICALVPSLGVFLSIRAMEYALPFSLIFLGVVKFKYYSDHRNNIPNQYPFRFSFYLKILVLTLAVFFMIYEGEMIRQKAVIKPLNSFTNFLKRSNIPEKTIIANIIWSDFPLLFYSAPKYRFLSGMDPMFSVYYKPKTTKQLELFRTGKIILQPYQLAELLNCKFAFVSKKNHLRSSLIKQGYKTIYNGEDGTLFTLSRPCPISNIK